MECF